MGALTMRTKPHFDTYHEQWVGEYETKNEEGEISRETRWFDDIEDADRFSRKGF